MIWKAISTGDRVIEIQVPWAGRTWQRPGVAIPASGARSLRKMRGTVTQCPKPSAPSGLN
jgi:hypothetical protein